ncbi:MAG TPA: ribonuclease H-like domain-containing protein [Caldisericia bacterium]|nr:ribonuclease H-like domain-containing protein [Caldisericia bacterium]HPF48361.1 ribonuclease H-like domain-containing protein [Caldisericia bacterium]HPI83460.1 ribonuclease H-like domain-containing protein [Caldisericia bacterium]HPQ92814.1 ribonuclease H-like domain-containing protein [Caldisericia bacterium]HRV74088.1 ribonuclease H-like domain-containing protein [Caldisericia bacterium]
MDLSQRLGRILGQQETKTPVARKQNVPLEEKIDGFWAESGNARVFVRETISSIENIPEGELNVIASTFGVTKTVAEENLLFIDTETTGLAGGTGTYAFMVGVARVEHVGKIKTTQFFMPSFSDEPYLLQLLAQHSKPTDVLVSFNGKVFDLPLLETRFALSRQTNPYRGQHHLDLLHQARVVWRRSLDSCSLQSLERNILGQNRWDDTPGSLIPEIYFSYLRDGQVGRIPGIFEHNQEDIVSLHKVLRALSSIFSKPSSKFFNEPVEQLSVGKYLARRGLIDKALPYLETAAESQSAAVADWACHEIGHISKRCGDYQRAFEQFAKICSEPTLFVSSRIEMAKHLEHREKDHHSALEVTNKTISYLRESNLLGGANLPGVKEELFHRQKRLLTKIEKSRSQQVDDR